MSAVLCLTWAADAHAGSWQALATDTLSSDSLATPITLATNTAGPFVTTDDVDGLGVAIAPDGRTAYVVELGTSSSSGKITPVDLSSDLAEPPIDLPGPGNFIAIAPDGDAAYVTDPTHGTVYAVNLSSEAVTTITVGGTPEGVAFTPNGTTAYVAESGGNSTTPGVVPIDVATGTPGSPITSGLGSSPFSIAVAPDGMTAYVGDLTSDDVYPIALSTSTVGSPVAAGGPVTAVAVSPDGHAVYAANGSGVVPISLPGDTAGSAISVGGAWAVAVTPDSRTLYVSSNPGGTVTPVDVAAGTAGTAITVAGTPEGIAITPDQAPTANFTVTSALPGAATMFDASTSLVPVGTIAQYAWTFGDGSATVITSSPTVTHSYAVAGTYPATVSETDSAGTSASGEVFTGQTASSVGSPGARASRSVVISSAPTPAVQLSTSSLSFGSVAVGSSSAARTVTIENTGQAPLTISGSALTGPAARDFRLSSDDCTGDAVAAGTSCSAAITFTPSVAGARTAALAFTDDASGSPHTLSLSGLGAVTASITGRVADGSQSMSPGVAGAEIVACPYSASGAENRAACATATTDATGAYTIGNLVPGTFGLEVYPTSAGLTGASKIVTVTAEAPLTQDFVLGAPQPLSGGVDFQTPGGAVGTGVPVVDWDEPFSFDVPVDIPAHGAPNSLLVVPVVGRIGLDAGGGTPGGFSLSSSADLAVGYDDHGNVEGIGGVDEGVGAAGSTAALRQAVAVTAGGISAGGIATGLGGAIGGVSGFAGLIPRVTYDPKNPQVSYFETTIPFPYMASIDIRITTTRVYVGGLDINPRLSLSYQIHQPVGDACDEAYKAFKASWPSLSAAVVRAYRAIVARGGRAVRARAAVAPVGGQVKANQAAEAAVAAGEARALAVAAQALGQPAGSGQIGSGMTAQVLVDGEPIELGQPDSAGLISLVRDGRAVSVQVQFTVPSLADRIHGDFDWSYTDPSVTTTFHEGAPPAGAPSSAATAPAHTADDSCSVPPPAPKPGGGGSGHIDPSGLVLTTKGAPVPTATVTLLQQSLSGVLAPVPNGSEVMSVANRRNPDKTNAIGHFGWDVLAGFYQVTASHPGCTLAGNPAATTPVFPVPPPVADLRLTLSCPHLTRSLTKLTFTAIHGPGRSIGLFVRLNTHHSLPAGFVTFLDGRRVLGVAPVDSRTRTAMLVTDLSGRPALTARYAGDGANASASARTQVKAELRRRPRARHRA